MLAIACGFAGGWFCVVVVLLVCGFLVVGLLGSGVFGLLC